MVFTPSRGGNCPHHQKFDVVFFKEVFMIRVTDKFRSYREELRSRKGTEGSSDIDQILADGARKARAVARETMREVRKAIGLPEEVSGRLKG